MTNTASPVFSQPSSSLRSEQSSSPSHLHNNRTQRPVPQRNWSAVHMDVAAGHTHKKYTLIRDILSDFLVFHHTSKVRWRTEISHVNNEVRSGTTHCSSSRLIGHRSRTRRHTSSRRWCTSRCYTWIQPIGRAGVRLHTHTHNQHSRLSHRTTCRLKTALQLKYLAHNLSVLSDLRFRPAVWKHWK